MQVKSAEDVVFAINEGYDNDKREEKAREYIGASIIGNPCDAFIAFNLRGFPNVEPDARLKRIFQLGHILEDEVVKDLKKKADIRVWEVDGLTNRQHTYEAWGGHIVCHMDGHVELDDQVVRVLEIKSMNDASFNKFKKNGVKSSHPQYFGQVQMMMGMSEMTETLFIAVNKNNSDYHAEIVKYDEFEFAHIKERIERAVLGKARKISEDGTDWRCRGCFKRGVCWDGYDVPVRCGTCEFASAHPSGAWHCTKHDKEASGPCEDYKKFEPLAKE
ncbi:MAG: hypothetical protein EBV86_00815 [Marivivens sp.]|nr:hypothetical protein [Marivivens sp.]